MSNSSKIKIIFLLPSLVPGGAERVMSFVSQFIDKKKFHPILLIAGYEKDTAYDVSNIDVIYLDKSRILTAIPSIIKHIYKVKPQIVVSSISHVNTAMSLIAPYFRNTKFIGREATILSKRKNEKKARKWSPINFMSNGYKNLDMVICQSKDMADDMISNFNIPINKISIINNPISNLADVKYNTTNSKIRRFITVGRLTEVKGHERLLEILSKVDFPFIYTIIGDGSLKESIFKKIDELGLRENIEHIPFTNRVNDYLSQNDIFLQGSFVEGFPNALLESCVVGTPVLAFNAPGGTKEIVTNNVNGFLVENKEEFLNKLNNFNIFDPIQVRNSVYKKFNKEKIIKDYEQLFLDILK
ncbi:glycosyltransferase [Winogradskyella sp. PE311]|uniref:glycosyltransferase n=1 Tax=Winogradskyella sp. PE311 TaxID=3366943 RepID=UPI003980D16E